MVVGIVIRYSHVMQGGVLAGDLRSVYIPLDMSLVFYVISLLLE